MNHYFFVAFFLIIAKCAAQEDLSQAEFLKEKLPGQWKEDQHKRKNLNNYLYEMGMYLIADNIILGLILSLIFIQYLLEFPLS